MEAWHPLEVCHHEFSKVWHHSAAGVPVWIGGQVHLSEVGVLLKWCDREKVTRELVVDEEEEFS